MMSELQDLTCIEVLGLRSANFSFRVDGLINVYARALDFVGF